MPPCPQPCQRESANPAVGKGSNKCTMGWKVENFWETERLFPFINGLLCASIIQPLPTIANGPEGQSRQQSDRNGDRAVNKLTHSGAQGELASHPF